MAIYFFDVTKPAKEIASYLITYELNLNLTQQRGLPYWMEDCLVNEVLRALNGRENRLIRSKIGHIKPFETLSDLLGDVDPEALEELISECSAYQYLMAQIDVTIKQKNTFHIWTFNKSTSGALYQLEDHGDFRITTFYKEHIRDGKYRPSPIDD